MRNVVICLSRVCVRARVYQSNCMMIPFHLFEALVPAEAVGADQRTTQLPLPKQPRGAGIDTISALILIYL